MRNARIARIFAAAVLLAPALAAQPLLKVEDYLLLSRQRLVLFLRDTPATARKGKAEVNCGGSVLTADFLQAADDDRVELDWNAALPALADCAVKLEAPGAPTESFRFTARPELRVVQETLPGRFGLRIVLRGNYPADLRKSADFELYEMTLDPSRPATGGAPAFYRRTLIPDTRLAKLAGEGLIAIYFPSGRMTRSDPVLWVRNIVSKLGEEMVLKDPASLRLPATPKSKDAAYGYIAVSHYAGPRVRPGTALDAKFDPLLLRRWGFLQGPKLTADVVWNTVPNLKSNDLIQLGWRGERFIRFLPRKRSAEDPLLAGVRLVPSAYFETNRLRTQRNALADVNAVWLFRDLYRPRAVRTRRAYWNALAVLPAGATVPESSQKPVLWGFAMDFQSGFEAGSALDEITVKASDKSSKIVVPGYSILRLKAQTHLAVEFWRFSVEGNAGARYLANGEDVSRETSVSVIGSDGKAASRTVLSLERMTGVKPTFDLTLRFALDPLGHYSIQTSYKNGALPPGFVYANFFRSGLVIQY